MIKFSFILILMHREGGNLVSDEYSEVIYNFLFSLGSIADGGTFTERDKSSEMIVRREEERPWTDQRAGLVTRVTYEDRSFS